MGKCPRSGEYVCIMINALEWLIHRQVRLSADPTDESAARTLAAWILTAT